MGYQDFRRASSPAWMRQAFGNAWNDAHASLEDGLVADAKAAVKASFPGAAPSDALPALGADLVLERGVSETEDSFRARLLAALDVWKWAGTDRGLREYALAPAGFTNTAVIRNRDWFAGPPDGDTNKWARIWVVIGKPNPWTDDGVWSDAGTYDDGGTWGSTATPEEIARMRRLIRTWIPAHVSTVLLYLALGNTTDFDAASRVTDLINADGALTGVVDAVWPGNGLINLQAVSSGAAGNAITLEAIGLGVTASGATLTGGADAVWATATVTISGGSGSLSVTINAGGGDEVFTRSWATSDAATASALAGDINDTILEVDPDTGDPVYSHASATAVGNVIHLQVRQSGLSGESSLGGSAGNAVTLAVTGTGITRSGPTFTGGANAAHATGTLTFSGCAGNVGALVDGERETIITGLECDGE